MRHRIVVTSLIHRKAMLRSHGIKYCYVPSGIVGLSMQFVTRSERGGAGQCVKEPGSRLAGRIQNYKSHVHGWCAHFKDFFF